MSPAPRSPAPAPQAELMRSLAGLVRGLSALFWGLPLALVVSVQTARLSFLAPLGIVPPILANALLLFGLVSLGRFQPQERVWRQALDRARLLAVVNVGLSPFLYWWKVLPQVPHYQHAVTLLAVSSVLLLFNLNQVLLRLAAMLPDTTLRLESRWFTTLNSWLLIAILSLAALWVVVGNWRPSEAWLAWVFLFASRAGVAVGLLMILLPVALTMALIWKMKEVVLGGVFGSEA